MKVRISPQKAMKNLYEEHYKMYYDESTGKLKNETEFFKEIYDNIYHINMAREYLNINKYIEFCVLENNEYFIEDKLTGTSPAIIRDIKQLINMYVNLHIMVIEISEKMKRSDKR